MNNKVGKVLAITGHFPSERFPGRGVFVRNLLKEMARQGASVEVIAPASWVTSLRSWRVAATSCGQNDLNVHAPIITTLPISLLGPFKQYGMRWHEYVMAKAVATRIPHIAAPNFCYAQFVPAGRAALKALSRRTFPVILNFGESSPWRYDGMYGSDEWVNELDGFDGIIAVSKTNEAYLRQRKPDLGEKLRYIPNGVDQRQFKPLDKTDCRRMLGLPDHAYAIFVGGFIQRKGVPQVVAALKHLQGDVRGLFLGTGKLRPSGASVAYAGLVRNDDMPLWLNAADVFVMPTLAEGMSNAMLEAMACGLPLVVSDRDFNREFLSEDVAIFVDPEDPADIARGIATCMDVERSKQMREAAARRTEAFSLENRVQAIFDYARHLERSTS